VASELFDKWLAHYDPIHRGYTPRGIANGVTATGGACFPRIGGGYNLYRGTDGTESIDFSLPVGAAGRVATSIKNFAWRPHAPSTRYLYVVKAIGGGGVESDASRPGRVAEFDAGGDLLGPRPNGPSELVVSPAAGGRFELRWVHASRFAEAVPAEFRVYHDNGTGTVDYATVVATVPYRRGKVHYRYLSAGFAHGARRVWGVRAVTSAAVDDGNELSAMGWADAAAPPVHPGVTLSRLAEE